MAANRRMQAAVAVLVGATLVGFGLLVVAFIGMARHPVADTAGPATTSSSTAPVVPSPLAVAVRAWESRAGEHFKESAQALEEVSGASDRNDEAGVRAGCQRLHDTNAVGLQADLPTPDPALTAELQSMIDDLNTATHACLRFANSRQPEDSSNYQTYLARAIDHLTTAKRILNEDLGQ
ncbi:hypothetical protein [Mycobacterium sp. M26]|uniref:hypothetical protein n=1 Tax=Mycobacterium sp. M26 TaxID=1762962 RepID=UPI00073EA0F6|nr:hypothetical protein [Mycobacterium sp. M26]